MNTEHEISRDKSPEHRLPDILANLHNMVSHERVGPSLIWDASGQNGNKNALVAFLGPAGSGKTEVLSTVENLIGQSFAERRITKVLHDDIAAQVEAERSPEKFKEIALRTTASLHIALNASESHTSTLFLETPCIEPRGVPTIRYIAENHLREQENLHLSINVILPDPLIRQVAGVIRAVGYMIDESNLHTVSSIKERLKAGLGEFISPFQDALVNKYPEVRAYLDELKELKIDIGQKYDASPESDRNFVILMKRTGPIEAINQHHTQLLEGAKELKEKKPQKYREVESSLYLPSGLEHTSSAAEEIKHKATFFYLFLTLPAPHGLGLPTENVRIILNELNKKEVIQLNMPLPIAIHE